ncbi:dienelactone hydrolase family protein [Haliea sp. E1-2-M8]|uniref:dienelactone hydrolase family protein n=1 Tax=Haliea sp. E1-2-M8 TaxID=3064706 RepID=UPI002718A80B|nr:dienelactone hydrolase family protein [Haliea sp. E1-2-M8]MDO8860756.1 dienelactone hydrolase family protein [Haliea sp. E1-2-M8]
MTSENGGSSETVSLALSDAVLEGALVLPAGSVGVVAFAHGSGSSRFSSRNQAVARYLNEAGLGTLLFDLLSREENQVDEVTREFRFDIPLIGRRMSEAVQWLARQPQTMSLRLGLFGASTGAAAALVAAAENPGQVQAVVSRGGRPDLAAGLLPMVQAPTLLIVGGLDREVIELNRAAAAGLRCEHAVEIVPGATHLFAEAGTLDRVQQLAADWFLRHLATPGQPPWR